MNEAAVVLIIKDGMILGVSRRKNKDKFGLPGGKLEPNELPLEAAIRETFEETGITVSRAEFIYRRDEEAEIPGGPTFHTYCFYASSWNGEPKSSEEGDVKWLIADQLTGSSGAFPEYNTNTLTKLRELFPDIVLK